MKNLKKIVSCLLSLTLLTGVFSLMACGSKNELSIYNCYDYIDESLLDEFESYYYEQTGEKISVKYSCFDTPEDAYNNLKIDPNGYDLICPSDYMIEKMATEGLIQKFEMDETGAYRNNVSKYIDGIFEGISWKENEETVSLKDYAVGYMWGTLGLVYNPEKVDPSDMQSWSTLWNKYEGKFSIKNSVRDTYFIGLAKHYANELNTAKANYSSSSITLEAYKNLLNGYFNDATTSTINAVKSDLISLAGKCKKLEVDDGKTDVVDGKIDIYFAWSGDAVYALDEAEDDGLTLEYSVPDEGSNVWFDGWVIPKNSQKVDAAKMFLDFISRPENAIKNMEEIGYTSVIAGDDVFNYAKDNYDEEEGIYDFDLGYFFGEGDYVISSNDAKRQLYTQYPTQDIINRCVCMSFFETDANQQINEMWITVKNNIR